MSSRVLLLLAAAGLLYGMRWLLTGAHPDREPAVNPLSAVASRQLTPRVVRSMPQGVSASDRVSPQPTADDSANLRPPVLDLGSGPLAWEQQIAQVAAQHQTAAARATALLSLLSTLPSEAIETTAEQAVEGLLDRDYVAVAMPVVTNANTPEAAMSVLFADLMGRPNDITLPTLLNIARNSRHPFAEAALDNLRLLLRADFGRDWAKWGAAIERQTLP